MENTIEIKENVTGESVKYYFPIIERLRLILMLPLCIYLLGFPTSYGETVKVYFGFVPIAFYIISGYLVLIEAPNRRERIVRAIKRSAAAFAVLAIIYFIINVLFYKYGSIDFTSFFRSKRFWFNFIFLNVWHFPIGTSLWYIQSLLYAYIIIYFLEKFNLLRFDWIIAAVCLVIAVCGGELCGIFKFDISGYNYLPGFFLTRALPYILLGGFIFRNMEFFGEMPRITYIIGVPGGFLLMFLETLFLNTFNIPGYYGHLIGMPITAMSICILAFQEQGFYPEAEFRLGFNRWETNTIYYICEPLGTVIALMISNMFGVEAFAKANGYISIITFVCGFCLAFVLSRIRISGEKRKAKRLKEIAKINIAQSLNTESK